MRLAMTCAFIALLPPAISYGMSFSVSAELFIFAKCVIDWFSFADASLKAQRFNLFSERGILRLRGGMAVQPPRLTLHVFYT